MSPICLELAVISPIVRTTSSTTRLPRVATSAAWRGKPRGLHRTVRVLLHVDGHLVHARRGFDERRGLFLGALREIRVAGGDFGRADVDVLGAQTHARHRFDKTSLHGLQRMQQAAAVVRGDRHAGGEIALRHQSRVFEGHFEIAAERVANAAQHQQHDGRGDGAERHGDREPAQQIGVERALHVVHVHAGDEIPVPRHEMRRVAGLGHRLVAAGLGPQIVDEAAAIVIARVDDIDEQMVARRVGELREILAHHVLLEGMHQHDRLRIVDGDVAVLAVTHRGQHVERLLLRVGFGERVLLGQRVVAGDDVVALIDQRG
jgi:hypothetical protein